MSNKRKNTKWDGFKDKMSKKRAGKKNEDSTHGGEYLTVQRVSSTVEGKCQKYSRIGPLTMVPIDSEPTLCNIKNACQNHFQTTDECDLLAGERGPSYTDVNQIKNWKVIHVRFIEPSTRRSGSATRPSISPNIAVNTCSNQSFVPIRPSEQISAQSNSEQAVSNNTDVVQSKVPASVPLSEMIKLGRLIMPKKEVAIVQLEEFSIEKKSWLDPKEVKLSLCKEKFASGGFRDAFEATVISGLKAGKYVLKRYKQDQISPIEDLFGSVEVHTRKVVQMNTLARNFAKMLEVESPKEFGNTFTYTKVYFAKLNGEFVTVENYLDGTGTFCKHINNTGEILCNSGSEVSLKAESYVHYTYVKSGKQLMVVDIQGIDYSLCDPEIASTNLMDTADDSILFCSGNLSVTAIDNFVASHSCNKYCDLLKLGER